MRARDVVFGLSMIASERLEGNKAEQTKRSAEGVVPLRKDELAAEESRWRMNAEAGLSAEAKLQASGRGWLWNWGCGVPLMRSVKPLRGVVKPLT